jgi:hypothetical protein
MVIFAVAISAAVGIGACMLIGLMGDSEMLKLALFAVSAWGGGVTVLSRLLRPRSNDPPK